MSTRSANASSVTPHYGEAKSADQKTRTLSKKKTALQHLWWNEKRETDVFVKPLTITFSFLRLRIHYCYKARIADHHLSGTRGRVC